MYPACVLRMWECKDSRIPGIFIVPEGQIDFQPAVKTVNSSRKVKKNNAEEQQNRLM